MCDPRLQKIVRVSTGRSHDRVFQTFDASRPSMR